MSAKTDLNLGDSVKLSLVSDPEEGTLATETYTIKVSLRDYPGSDFVLLPINVSYFRNEECQVTELLPPQLSDQSLSVGSAEPLLI